MLKEMALKCVMIYKINEFDKLKYLYRINRYD